MCQCFSEKDIFMHLLTLLQEIAFISQRRFNALQKSASIVFLVRSGSIIHQRLSPHWKQSFLLRCNAPLGHECQMQWWHRCQKHFNYYLQHISLIFTSMCHIISRHSHIICPWVWGFFFFLLTFKSSQRAVCFSSLWQSKTHREQYNCCLSPHRIK